MMTHIYYLTNKYGIWYIKSIIENTNKSHVYYDIYNDKLLYVDTPSNDTLSIDELKSLVNAFRIIKLCGGIDRAKDIYTKSKARNLIRHDLRDAIASYKHCKQLNWLN